MSALAATLLELLFHYYCNLGSLVKIFTKHEYVSVRVGAHHLLTKFELQVEA